MPNPFSAYTHWLHTRWPAGTVEKLPEVREGGSTAVPGLYVVGDLTGVPLLKFALDSGARVAQRIAEDPARPRGGSADGVLDVVIVGGGVSGMAAAMEAHRRALRYEVFEAAGAFATVANFPKGKPIYTYPLAMVPAGALQVSATVKEPLLEELRRQAIQAGVQVTYARVERIARDGGALAVHLEGGRVVRARRVVVAIGRSGNYRKLRVPGEELDKVMNRLHDPRDYTGRRVLVVGGGDAAAETAIALTAAGADVTLAHRGRDLTLPKPDNLEKLRLLAANPDAKVAIEHPTDERATTAMGDFMPEPGHGHLSLRAETVVTAIAPQHVMLQKAGGAPERLENDVVFTMIGREAPLDFFRRSGVRIRGESSPLGWLALAAFMACLALMYDWKSGGWLEQALWARWAFPGNAPLLLARLGAWWAAQVADRATLVGTVAVSMKSRSFYYTVAYTLLVGIFGVRRVLRRPTPYVGLQTLSLFLVQALPLFILPEILLPWLGYNGVFSHGAGKTIADHLFESYIPAADYAARHWPDWGHPRAYWRAYGLILAFPLNVYNVLTDQPLWWWLGIAFAQTFVLIPLAVWRWGKGAYCGWVCSCGALAETVGDGQRGKMPHGPRMNRLNMVGQVFLAFALVLVGLRVGAWLAPDSGLGSLVGFLLEGKNADHRLVNPLSYKWVVDILAGGLLGVGLYFKYSGRVWCRFACPLAALMHVYARFSRFAIVSEKKKCISCNVCTSVCHQGIDVMGFANKGVPMQDPECVRCSACVQSCPTGVLQFGRVKPGGDVIALDLLPASPVRVREARKA